MKSYRDFLSESFMGDENQIDPVKHALKKKADAKAAREAARVQKQSDAKAHRAKMRSETKGAQKASDDRMLMNMQTSFGDTYPDVEPYEKMKHHYPELHRTGELSTHMNRIARREGFRDSDHMFSVMADEVPKS